jgi:hypothetical protein
MHHVGAGLLGQSHDVRDIQIGGRAAPFQGHRLVCHLGVQGRGVVGGVNRGCLQFHIGGGTHNSNGDFTSVGDQQVGKFH